MTTESHRHSQSTGVASAPAPAPPLPSFLFRGHDAPIHSLEFFASNTFLATGDETGWIYVWDIWKRRQIYRWQGHPSASVLALKAISIQRRKSNVPMTGTKKCQAHLMALQDPVYIVSHGRDNEIHVWDINDILQKSLESSSSTNSAAPPSKSQNLAPVFSLPVNAVNFCKMSILAIDAPPFSSSTSPSPPENKGDSQELKESPLRKTHQHFYIAVPSPTTPTLIDIYDIVKPERKFASIGVDASVPQGTDEKKWGSVMAIQLFQTRNQTVMDLSALVLNDDTSTASATHDHPDTLHMLVGYEDGSVCLFQESAPLPSSKGQKQKHKMQVLWTIKCHREPVLGLDVSSDLQFAVSCGSDNVLAKYDLSNRVQGVPEVLKESLKSNGIADIKIRSDNKIIGLAGWDGRIRIFSAKALKPLAVLKHHREGLYCLGFAQIRGLDQSANAEEATSNGQNKVEACAEKDSASALQEVDDGDSSDKDSGDESDEDSDSEYILQERQQWSRRHWIAAGGKENRISLWEIY